MVKIGGLGLGALALAALLGTSASVTSAWAQPAKGLIRVGTDVDSQSLDPRLMRETTGFRAINLIYSALIQLDDKVSPKPDLATKWENPDPKTWIFTLRRDARFHDGKPVTAADVVFTYTTILDPALNARFRVLYTPIDKVEAVDEGTVRISLKEPYAPLLSYLDLGIVPKHAVEGGRDLNVNPLGSGPYKFAKWDRGSRISLEANADYFGGKPKYDKLDFVVVPDNTARAQAFEAGDLDLIQSPLSPRDIKRLAAAGKAAYAKLPGIAVTYLNINTKSENLGDPKVRKALAMLIDQKTIVEQIYEGTDQAATSLLLPSLAWSYSAAVKQPAFDAAKAKALFAEAGWKPGADGVLAKDGKKFSITIGTHSEDPNRVQSVEFIQNVLKQNGVDAKVAISDWPSFSGGVANGKHDVGLMGWVALVDPDRLMYGQLHSAGGLNWGKYSNAKVDAALTAGRSAATLPARAVAYQEAATVLADEVPYYVISYQGFHVFADKSLAGFVPDPRGYLRSLAAK